jgi:hypothetical protein
MPAARSPADILCLALYVLAAGRLLRGFMVTTVADRLGIDFERCEAMAIAGLVKHVAGTVMLTGDGYDRAATLTAPAKTSDRPVVVKPPRPARRQPRAGL